MAGRHNGSVEHLLRRMISRSSSPGRLSEPGDL
jgi:hypothetical protein